MITVVPGIPCIKIRDISKNGVLLCTFYWQIAGQSACLATKLLTSL